MTYQSPIATLSKSLGSSQEGVNLILSVETNESRVNWVTISFYFHTPLTDIVLPLTLERLLSFKHIGTKNNLKSKLRCMTLVDKRKQT